MQITVKETPAGWLVQDGETMGPFSKQRAMDLAEGMVVAIRTHTEKSVDIVIEEATPPRSSAKARG
jgi:hypothetical protein